MFKSRIEIREFAVRQAVELLGTGSPQKDIVAKARDIEAYIIGEADLPEVYNDTEAINGIMGSAMQMLQGISSSEVPVEDKPAKKK